MANGQYSRLYHVLMDDFPDVFASDAQLALFVRALMVAEKFYPQWPPINSKRGVWHQLVIAGLIIESPDGHRYTIKGLSSERERRSRPARIANAVRWDSERTPNGLLVREEKRKEEKEKEKKSPNGLQPQTFMGFRPKPTLGSHDGQHPDCTVCAPLREKAESA